MKKSQIFAIVILIVVAIGIFIWQKNSLHELPEAEKEKITGKATLGYGNNFDANLYNGSDWKIEEITIELRYYDNNSSQPIIDRVYRIKGISEPLSNKHFSTTVEPYPNSKQFHFEWDIKSVKGKW